MKRSSKRIIRDIDNSVKYLGETGNVSELVLNLTSGNGFFRPWGVTYRHGRNPGFEMVTPYKFHSCEKRRKVVQEIRDYYTGKGLEVEVTNPDRR